LTNSSK